jgi:hypothetical protein
MKISVHHLHFALKYLPIFYKNKMFLNILFL